MACGFESRPWYVFDYNALNIYTDGSFYPASRNGGVGFVFVFPEHLNKQSEQFCPYGYKKASNNQMELMACCLALKECLRFEKKWGRIIIHTDSSYIVDNYKSAVYWKSNGWKNRDGRPVSNPALWKELLKLVSEIRLPVDFKWVKGHSIDENNKKVDKLAKESARKALNKPLKVVTVRRKITREVNKVGSVLINGQKLSIRIVEVEYLVLSKSYKCKYEVRSKFSESFGLVDVVYSDSVLRVGHEYYVKFDSDTKYPKIEKIFIDKTRRKRLLG